MSCYEWNAAVEQTLSNADVFSLTYVGAGGRKLMRKDYYVPPSSNPTFAPGAFAEIMRNAATSNYDSLQVQYRHRVTHGLQALLSYSWAHSIDDVSSDAYSFNVPLSQSSPSDRSSSDFDIRHTFSGGVSYDISGPGTGVLKHVFGGWSTDTIVYARSAPPVNVVTGSNPFPGTLLFGANSVQRPDVVPGVPFYLHPSGAPGGKIINPAAFSNPGTAQGNLGRNAMGYHAAPPVPLHGEILASIPRRFFQRPQSPEFREPSQLPDLSAIRHCHRDAEQLPRQHRLQWRPQSAVPNWWPTLDPTRAQAAVLASPYLTCGRTLRPGEKARF